MSNKGAAGVEGITVGALKSHLQQNWPSITEGLLNGSYCPQPVRRVSEQRAWQSALNGRGPWYNAGASPMNDAFRKSFFDTLGLVSLVDRLRRFQHGL